MSRRSVSAECAHLHFLPNKRKFLRVADERDRIAGHRPAGRTARGFTLQVMCRNIRNLYNFEPPATQDEVRASALQYVRKVSGFNKPSKANEAAFAHAVDAVAAITTELLAELETAAPPKNREEEAAKARARSAQRYAA
jgi:hypothetical protein